MNLFGGMPSATTLQPSPAELTLLYNLMGVRPDATRTPPPNLGPRPTIGPQPTGPQVVTPGLLMQVARFVAEIAPGSGEGIAAREALDALRQGNGKKAFLAAIGFLPVVGDAVKGAKKLLRAGTGAKKAAAQQLDAIMYTPETGFFEGIKGNKTVVSGRYDGPTLRSMLGDDTYNRLMSSEDLLGTRRIEARPPVARGRASVTPDAAPGTGPASPPALGNPQANIIETLALLGLLGGAGAMPGQQPPPR